MPEFSRVLPASATRQASVLAPRPPLHPLEIALLGVTTLHLCFLPWALGTMHVWSQGLSLGLAASGFFLALLPRRGTSLLSSPAAAFRPGTRLAALAWFWGGLALLAYILVQGCNPAWQYASDANSWWLEPVAHAAWLPAGIAAPFEQSNPWRSLVVLGSLWLLVCSVWIGFTRRHSYRLLFSLLAANAALLSLLGLLQLLGGTKQIFWSYLPSNGAFSGSFIYPNHAGAYLNLMVALSTGLALWCYRRAQHGLEKPGLTWLFSLIAAFASLMVVLSYSRASIALLLAFLFVSSCAHGLRLLRRKIPAGGLRLEVMPFVLMFAGFLATGLVALNSEKAWGRFAELFANPAVAAQDRRLAREAAGEMLRDRWLLGWGAGGFSHAFPLYARKYPAIYAEGRRHWEHAHCDLLEFPIELGAAGLLPLAAVVAQGAWHIARRRFRRNAVSASLLAGCCLLLVHAGVDFVLQCPAVLLTAGVMFAGMQRWAELDDPYAPGGARRDPGRA